MKRLLYRLIVPRLETSNITRQDYRDRIFNLVDKGIGGFIIFGNKTDMRGVDEIRSFIDELQARSEAPLLIASDIERGTGSQIGGCTVFPCQMAIGAGIHRDKDEDISLLRSVIRAIAREAKYAGINMPLIPVFDVNTNPDNPIICTRAFSDDPQDVAYLGEEYIRVFRDEGLVSCVKHFPGHGNTSIDSHLTLPEIDISMEDLMDIHIYPFKQAIKTGVEAIMVGHLLIPVLDNKPASLSKRIITGLLREELSFHGLVITDALDMSALRGVDNVFVEAINAGVDILLHPSDPDKVVDELYNGLINKTMNEDRIMEAIQRITEISVNFDKEREMEHKDLQHISLNGQYDHLHDRVYPGEYISLVAHEDLSKEICRKALTLLKKRKDIIPLNPREGYYLFYGGEASHLSKSLWHRVSPNLFPLDPDLIPFDKGSGSDFQGICIFLLFPETKAWRGHSGLENREIEMVNRYTRNSKASIIISFGSPYVLSSFRDGDVLIAAYDPGIFMQEAVIDILKGRIEPQGRLPVRIII